MTLTNICSLVVLWMKHHRSTFKLAILYKKKGGGEGLTLYDYYKYQITVKKKNQSSLFKEDKSGLNNLAQTNKNKSRLI